MLIPYLAKPPVECRWLFLLQQGSRIPVFVDGLPPYTIPLFKLELAILVQNNVSCVSICREVPFFALTIPY